jgi:very-short-patch-repair endonuclease
LANENARALRKRLTPQEVKLWVKLRELKLLGFHFRRQAPIGRYIVDFVSFRSQLIIEADGGQHGMPEGARSDQATPSCSRRVLEFFDSGIQTSMSISLA